MRQDPVNLLGDLSCLPPVLEDRAHKLRHRETGKMRQSHRKAVLEEEADKPQGTDRQARTGNKQGKRDLLMMGVHT